MTRVARRGEAALSLKLAGATFAQVTDTLGYPSEAAARLDIMNALADGAADIDREKHRHLATMRLEQLLRAIYNKAVDGANPEQLPASRQAKDLVVEIAKLNGAPLPTELVIHNPGDDQLMAWIARMTAHELPAVDEVDPLDIVDAELIE